MRKFFLMAVISVVLSVTMFSVFAVAQEQEDLVDSAYGTVVSISDGSVTLNEYDFDLDTEKSMIYEITADTELENIDSLEEIKAGSEVSVECIVKDGKNQIVSIYLYEEEE
ncbi:MAG: hypothetical protein ISS33_00120 [Candidatus Omnitrophica bacterium]|nr:hypothetical protein [Candidatus Omnitrophota bacterium]